MQASTKQIYFIFCIVFKFKKEKKYSSCGFEKENESFDENTFVNKNLQNLKMYIQK